MLCYVFIHINDYILNISSLIIPNFSWFIVISHSADAIFRFWVTSQWTWAVYRRECKVIRNVSIHIFWMLFNICLNIDVIYVPWIKIYYYVYYVYFLWTKYIFETSLNPLKIQIISIMLHFYFIHERVYCMVY